MADETASAPSGIQLRLEGLTGRERRTHERQLDSAGVSDFAALVLFILDNLSAEDQRRVLSWAYQRVGHR